MSERTPLSLAADGLLKAGKSPDPLHESPVVGGSQKLGLKLSVLSTANPVVSETDQAGLSSDAGLGEAGTKPNVLDLGLPRFGGVGDPTKPGGG